MKKSFLDNSDKYFILAIDDYNGSELVGKIYHSSKKALVSFTSIMQMVLIVEETLEELHYPMRTMEQRQFAITSYPNGVRTINCKEDLCEDPETIKGNLGTARLCIKHRDSLTWQGEIIWLEEERTDVFKSFLQLMLDFDRKLGGGTIPDVGPCPSHVFRIGVENYAGDSMKGGMYQTPSGKRHDFHSVMELIKMIHYSMEYGDSHTGSELDMADLQMPDYATFTVRILFSENLSWQGSLRLNKAGESIHFRSFMELLFLMDATLSEWENSCMRETR